jgi:prepilin-type N-terminal cleavage/methylation domain-containing protein
VADGRGYSRGVYLGGPAVEIVGYAGRGCSMRQAAREGVVSMRTPRRPGFTLVEMLVVIAIIVVLMAILFPVFASVRGKAREAQCRSNLHQLAIALKGYKEDHGRYPGPPMWNGTRYIGGFSDLYPDYIDSTKLLVCPDDLVARRIGDRIKDTVYCSYNGRTNAPSNWDFVLSGSLPEIYYNYNGYDGAVASGPGVVTQPCNSTGIDDGGSAAAETGYLAALESDYAGTGLTLRDAPRLKNRSAPGNTIVAHCTNHRGRDPNDAQARDFVIRLDGTGTIARHMQWDGDPDGAGPKVSLWISQTD